MNSVYEGGIEALSTIGVATDAHEAVGSWWAHAIISPNFDNGGTNQSNAMARSWTEMGRLMLQKNIEQAIGGFAIALGDLSRQRELDIIEVDYLPDPVLREAARLAGMPVYDDPYIDMVIYPWKSMTRISDDVVYAHSGVSQPMGQVWPPVLK